ncbi:MAG: hypothetical protein GY764_11315 [Halieaceae bacterium]|nr:hypothetical protein [Halieaceae bacterium]
MNVWILSEGEKYEGERVLAVFGSWFDALEELEAIAAGSFDDAEIEQSGDVAKIESGIFYTIIRPQEVL